jgi:3-deoxy-D-manno-octulosonate 8-phosphate phosphatase (KDO 8-P phosphatase)
MLLLDVDGILTDGLLYLSNSGDEYKTFNTLDGQGIRIAISKQLQIGIITGRKL